MQVHATSYIDASDIVDAYLTDEMEDEFVMELQDWTWGTQEISLVCLAEYRSRLVRFLTECGDHEAARQAEEDLYGLRDLNGIEATHVNLSA